MKPIIQIKNLSKKYKYREKKQYYTLRDSLATILNIPENILKDNIGGKLKRAEFWALRGINLDIKKGEVFGVIGANGAGKTTLLKILSKITPPTKGTAILHGRVASLLEVGTGFHQELTGKENIYLNGAILGMSRKEIKSKYEEIIDFAGVEKFLDTPIKHYSSGMRVRLAFSIAAHLEPEILLVDEVLSVGDAEFQKKSLGKMHDVSKSGRTVLFVSHNMSAVKELCDSVLYLDKGCQKMFGSVNKVLPRYLDNYKDDNLNSSYREKSRDIPIQILCISLTDKKGKQKNNFSFFEDIHINVEYIVREKLVGSVVNFMLKRNAVNLLLSFDTDLNRDLFENRGRGHYISEAIIPGELLKSGSYSLDFKTGFSRGVVTQTIKDRVGFTVEATSNSIHFSYDNSRNGLLAFPLKWQTQKNEKNK